MDRSRISLVGSTDRSAPDALTPVRERASGLHTPTIEKTEGIGAACKEGRTSTFHAAVVLCYPRILLVKAR